MESSQQAAWSVVCLCAAWCDVCRQYRPSFEALAQKNPTAIWRWVDVEDFDDIVSDLDVETFPTILIANGSEVVFFGPLLPQAQVLERLVQSLQQAGGCKEPVDRLVQEVWAALRVAL